MTITALILVFIFVACLLSGSFLFVMTIMSRMGFIRKILCFILRRSEIPVIKKGYLGFGLLLLGFIIFVILAIFPVNQYGEINLCPSTPEEAFFSLDASLRRGDLDTYFKCWDSESRVAESMPKSSFGRFTTAALFRLVGLFMKHEIIQKIEMPDRVYFITQIGLLFARSKSLSTVVQTPEGWKMTNRFSGSKESINLWQVIDPHLKSYATEPTEYDGTESYEKDQRAVRAKIGKFFLFQKGIQFGAVRIIKETGDYDGGAEYEWYFQEDGSGNFLKDNCKHGYGKVFENYKEEKTNDNEYNVTDIGSVLNIKCGPFAVEWSGGNWIYLNDSAEITFSTTSSLEKINVFDKNLEWLKKTTEKDIIKLREQLKDKDHIVRYYAVDTLGGLDDKKSIPQIKELLNDESDIVRNAAREALKTLGVPEDEIQKAKIKTDIDRLFNDFLNEKFIEYSGLSVCSGWVITLPSGRTVVRSFLDDQAAPIIAYGPEAVPHLFKWLKIDNISVRYIAIYSLQQITGVKPYTPYFATQKEDEEKKFIEKAIPVWQEWYDKYKGH
ncbi:MAG: HEAT repeat domain-containing protein [Planctomycetota bacterium]